MKAEFNEQNCTFEIKVNEKLLENFLYQWISASLGFDHDNNMSILM